MSAVTTTFPEEISPWESDERPARKKPWTVPDNLESIALHQLEKLCDQAFEELEKEDPAEGARECYLALRDALQSRTALPREASAPAALRTVVHDNQLLGRFELYADGVLAAYIQYQVRGGEIWMLRTCVHEDYKALSLQTQLIGEALAHVHRRRLAVLPFCPATRAFMAVHPQFAQLVPAEEQSRFPLRMPKKRRRPSLRQ